MADSVSKVGVFNGVSEEVILAVPGPILVTPLLVQGELSVVRFTISGSVAAIFTLIGWATFPMEIHNGVATASKTFVVEVRAGMSLNIVSDTAGTFKVIASEVIGGVI